MRYPNFVPNPSLMSDECRVFRPGEPVQVRRAPMVIGDDGDVFGLAAPVPAATWGVLDHAVGIVHRITPWTTVCAAPVVVVEGRDDGFSNRDIIRRKDSDTDYVKVGGLSFNTEGLIALSMTLSATDLISISYHESWHQVEKILDKNILDEIDDNLIPSTWGSRYLDSMIERRARCFEHWCMRFEEGLPNIRLSSRIDEIFDVVAAGEAAREWYRTQQKAAKRAR